MSERPRCFLYTFQREVSVDKFTSNFSEIEEHYFRFKNTHLGIPIPTPNHDFRMQRSSYYQHLHKNGLQPGFGEILESLESLLITSILITKC